MARGQSSSSGGRSSRRPCEADTDLRSVSYAQKILRPSDGRTLKTYKVHARNRVELAEALPYFQISRGSTYIEDNLVQGFLLNNDENDVAYGGRQGYMDAEVVIARIPVALPWHTTATGGVSRNARRRAHADQPVQYSAFWTNLKEGIPLILILDRMWKHSIFQWDEGEASLRTRYVVLDHFMVSAVWREPNANPENADAFFVRFEKLDLDSSSWWISPAIAPPPASQKDTTDLPSTICTQCGDGTVRIYVEEWLCSNPGCVYFGCNADGVDVAFEQLTYHDAFLKQRTARIRSFPPKYDLVPDLISHIKSQQMYTMYGKLGNKASADLWRAIICPNCNLCVPRIFWHSWCCEFCKRVYNYAPNGELYKKFAFMQEFGLSQTSYPSVDIICPTDYRTQPFLTRPTYRMDRVFLHGSAYVTLLSHTDAFNQDENGPNDVFNQLLAQAHVDAIPLRRRRLYPHDNHSGKRTPYFAAMYGEQYDFSKLASIKQDQTPLSVVNASTALMAAAENESGRTYTDKFNQASLECYFDGMSMPWHCDGDREIGGTIAMLSLGSKAQIRIRLKQNYYQNSNLRRVIKGSYNWRNLAEVQRLVQSGVDLDEAWAQMPAYEGPDNAPEVVLPVNHGSIVIFHGKHFTKYYEHAMVNTGNDSGSLNFTITARHIDATRHAAVKSRHPFARQAGPKFSFIRDPLNDDSDDELYDDVHYSSEDSDDSDDSDDDDYYDYSTSYNSSSNDHSGDSNNTNNTSRKNPPPVLPVVDEPTTQEFILPMRPYNAELDSEEFISPVLTRKILTLKYGKPGSKETSTRGRGGTRRGRGARTGTTSSGRDRSRSPARTGRSKTPIRVRDRTSSEDPEEEEDVSEEQVTAGIDPDNIPRVKKGTRWWSGEPPRIQMQRTRPFVPNGRLGRKLHRWTVEEMEQIRLSGLLVTQGKSTWANEMKKMPTDVRLKNVKERYWRYLKKLEGQ